MSSSSKKDGNEKRDSLVDQVFSWSLHDIFNHNLYKDKVLIDLMYIQDYSVFFCLHMNVCVHGQEVTSHVF